MSFVVLGREIPPTCSQCNYRYYDADKDTNCCEFTDEEIWNVRRGDGCHLHDLPGRHGKLVDANALIDAVLEAERKNGVLSTDDVCHLIEKATAVVPPEGDLTEPEEAIQSQKNMLVKSWADKLDGREYGSEITKAEASEAAQDGIVIVYGYSDDNMEFNGALYDEVGCFDGGVARVCEFGVYTDEAPANTKLREIKAVWCAPGKPAWSYETDIPHEKFNINEDGELFCEGIVFSLEDLRETKKYVKSVPYDLLYEEGGATTTM